MRRRDGGGATAARGWRRAEPSNGPIGVAWRNRGNGRVVLRPDFDRPHSVAARCPADEVFWKSHRRRKRVASLAPGRPVLRMLARIEPLAKRATAAPRFSSTATEISSPIVKPKKGRRWRAAH